MEILRNDFLQQLKKVTKAIGECDFMAIDTELTGLDPDTKSRRSTHSFESILQRYEHFRSATSSFIIVQFGLCTFKWDEESRAYIAKPFNFFVFPSSNGGRSHLDRVFSIQAGSFDFLAKNHFDFNKWVYQGVPYMTLAEETVFKESLLQKLNDEIPDIPIGERHREFVEQMRQLIKNKVDAWIADLSPNKMGSVNITTSNGYQRRLVYQEIRNRYKELSCEGRTNFINIFKPTAASRAKRFTEKKKRFDEDLQEAQGLRHIIELMSTSKKPIVGHNMMLDICHMHAQFIQPLPEDLATFKSSVHETFPLIFDTKYICETVPDIQVFMSSTRLDEAKFVCSSRPFTSPRIDMHIDHPRYNQGRNHEAGYDAFMTGFVFLRTLGYISAERKRASEPQSLENPSNVIPDLSSTSTEPINQSESYDELEAQASSQLELIDQSTNALEGSSMVTQTENIDDTFLNRRMSWKSEAKTPISEDGWGTKESTWEGTMTEVESLPTVDTTEHEDHHEDHEILSDNSTHTDEDEELNNNKRPEIESFPVLLFDVDGNLNMELLGPFVNKCNLGKSAFKYLDFTGKELLPPIHNIFHLSSLNPQTQSTDIVHLFSSFGKAFVDWSNDTSCIVAFEQLHTETSEIIEKIQQILREKGMEGVRVQTLGEFLEAERS